MAKKDKKRKLIIITSAAIAGAFGIMGLLAKLKHSDSVYINDADEKNPFEGKKVKFVFDENDAVNADGSKGHLVEIGISNHKDTFYDKYVKRGLDILLSGLGLVVLSPIFAGISLAIVIDDPGPVLFTQKRVGKNKQFFKLHKFRSMKMSTPHDVPTHMLENPEQYITRVGKFLRSHSLDELPQVWDIFVGNMSVVGPRPALWTQDVLTAERDQYGANDIKPGLTGWAQINGRDELEISDKARLDGEYVEKESFLMDIRCFLGTLGVFKGDDTIVEGGTGEMEKRSLNSKTHSKVFSATLRPGVPEKDPAEDFGFKKHFDIDKKRSVKVLVVGEGSYIGETFKTYAEEHYPNIDVDVIGTLNGEWRDMDFSSYDCIYDVAGIAHADVGNVSDDAKEKYYAVNTDLTLEIANKAKEDNKNKDTQFIFMSSAIIYGDSAPYGTSKMIDEDTVPTPANFYGDSKWQADKGVRVLVGPGFNVAVLRPPMIYGKGSKGNYPTLAKLAKKLPIFPNVDNERSMLYVGNLCEFLCQLMLSGEGGIYFPQNKEYTKTSEMVREISAVAGKKIAESKVLNLAVKIGQKVPGKIGSLFDKAFGNLTYDQKLSQYDGIEYQKNTLKESIEKTEGIEEDTSTKKHILAISQYFYPEQFRINDMACEWVKRGYKVTVLTGIPNYPMGKYFEGYDLTHKRHETWNGVEIIRIPLIARGSNSIGMMANYGSFVVSGFFWNLVNKIKADEIFMFEVSPMTQALIGVQYKKQHHVPLYLYVQDLWPENVEIVTGVHNPAVIKPIASMVQHIYKNCDHIFATSPSFVKEIQKRCPGEEYKVSYWPQYAEDFYKPVSREIATENCPEIPASDAFKIVFTGNIGKAQGLDILPRTAKELKNENVQFIIVGDGREQENFKQAIHDAGVESMFTMTGRKPMEHIPDILGCCDAAFLSFMDNELFTKTIPAKLQSYMACGIPIIASASGESERIISEADCGLCSPIGDTEKLAENIRTLMNDPDRAVKGGKARKYFEEHFEKKLLMDQINEYLK